MPSAASASIAALQPREAPKPPTMPTATVPAPPAISTPAMPSLPVVNPETAQQESWIRDQLDPSKAAFVGNKYKPGITAAGGELRQQLAGYGAYDWTEGSMGELSYTERQGTGESLGEEYRKESLRQIAAANARGMQYSRLADEAVGIAWSRLNQQKRDFFTRYATTVSTSLQQMQSEISGLTTSLVDLYGRDAQYAVENPILGSEPAAEAAATGGGAAAASGAPRAPILWKGTVRPKMQSIAKKQGIPVSQLQRKTRGGGKGYVVVRK